MKFISLVKPGIILGNTITLFGGYFVGAKNNNFSTLGFLSTLIGMVLTVAAGCVLNNYVDRDIDCLMERTKSRSSACGLVSLKFTLNYACILGFFGSVLLYLVVNLITVIIALIGLITYVMIYTLYSKRNNVFGTIIGGIAGALPPVIGYTAATGCFNHIAIVLFLILFCWQIPHFFAIAIYRIEDYKAAKVPVLPLKKGFFYTEVNMLIFVILYISSSIILNSITINAIFYLISIVILGFMWLLLTLQGFITNDTKQWSRKMFSFSIFSITILNTSMSLTSLLNFH